MLSANDREQIQSIISQGQGFEDQNSKIRELKHSGEIRRCVRHIMSVKKEFPGADRKTLDAECMKGAGFLFFHYMNIYNTIIKFDDLSLMEELLDVLAKIEDEKLDQHEGSYVVGVILKKMYIDNTIQSAPEAAKRPDPKPVSWAQYKAAQANKAALANKA